jgi:hypothetical protein
MPVHKGYLMMIVKCEVYTGVIEVRRWSSMIKWRYESTWVWCALRYITAVQYSAMGRRLKKVVKVIYVSCRINSYPLRGLLKVLKPLQTSQYIRFCIQQPVHARNTFSLDRSLIKGCYILYFVCTWSIEEKWIKYESVSILLGSENHFRRRYLQWNTLDTEMKLFNLRVLPKKPITMAVRSEAWNVFARSNTGILNSNPTQGTDVCLCLFYVCV